MKKMRILAVLAVVAFVSASCHRVKCPSAAGQNDLPVPQDQVEESV